MILKESDWYFDAALTAKRKTIKSAIELVLDVERQLNDGELMVSEETMKSCQDAVIAFKKAIRDSNKAEQNMLALRLATNTFFNIVNCEAYQDKTAQFEAYLLAQDYNEFSTERLNFALNIAAALAVVALLVTSFIGLMTLPPSPLLALSFFTFIVSIMPAVGLSVATVCTILDTLADNENRRRDVVGGRDALSRVELDYAFFSAPPTQKAASIDEPSAPPMAHACAA